MTSFEQIIDVYEDLKAAGLLRGSELNDQVKLKPEALGSMARSGSRLAVALSALGSFDRLHIENDRQTGECLVARDTERWLQRRLVGILVGDNGYAEEDWREWTATLNKLGGPEAVVRMLREMARSR